MFGSLEACLKHMKSSVLQVSHVFVASCLAHPMHTQDLNQQLSMCLYQHSLFLFFLYEIWVLFGCDCCCVLEVGCGLIEILSVNNVFYDYSPRGGRRGHNLVDGRDAPPGYTQPPPHKRFYHLFIYILKWQGGGCSVCQLFIFSSLKGKSQNFLVQFCSATAVIILSILLRLQKMGWSLA